MSNSHGLVITEVLVPRTLWGLKSPYLMTPDRIIVHNTANDASAINERNNVSRPENKSPVSFHYSVDHIHAVRLFPESRNTWNAGDGTAGKGNRKGISIEICYSKSGGSRFTQSEINGAKLVAYILTQRGWGINKVTKHQDYNRKYCPHRTLDLGWNRFLKLVEGYLAGGVELPKPDTKPRPDTKPTTANYKVGDTVSITKVFGTSMSTSGIVPYYKKGTITRVIEGARNPYLLNGGGIGWVNNECIKDSTKAPVPATGEVKVGDVVTFTRLATSSTANSTVSTRATSGTVDRIFTGADYPYRIKSNGSWIGFVNNEMVGRGTTPSKPVTKPVTKPSTKPTSSKAKVGDTVTFSRLAGQSNATTTIRASKTSGVIDRVFAGTKYPYRIKSGNSYIGFVNDEMIGKAVSTAPSKPKVGQRVNFTTLATSSNGRVVKAGVKSGTIDRVFAGTKYPYRIKSGNSYIGFVNESMIK